MCNNVRLSWQPINSFTFAVGSLVVHHQQTQSCGCLLVGWSLVSKLVWPQHFLPFPNHRRLKLFVISLVWVEWAGGGGRERERDGQLGTWGPYVGL